jgi:hypothetical protein
MTTRPIDRVLDALHQHRLAIKRRHGYWSCQCPAHDDGSPSMTLTEGRDGRALVKCFSGCPFEAIAAALDLKPADFMPDDPSPTHRAPRPFARSALARRSTFAAPGAWARSSLGPAQWR